MVVEEALRRVGSELSGLLFGRVRKWWKRRTLAKRLHTKLCRTVHDRPEPDGHPPPFYRDTSEDIERAVELDLFSTHELEYLAEQLATYCRAKQEDKPTRSVEIDKTYLEWTRVMELEGMHPFDVSEIEKRLRQDLQDRYTKQMFDHPVNLDQD